MDDYMRFAEVMSKMMNLPLSFALRICFIHEMIFHDLAAYFPV